MKRACTSCEISVVVPEEDLPVVVGSLSYQKGERGCKGRGLTNDLPELGLRAKDRLEATRSMPDIGAIDGMQGPATFTFWRQSCETAARQCCPLLCPELHIGPQNSGIDWLHTISLGVCGNWVAEAVWDLAGKNVYRILGPAADKTELSFARLFEEFGQWCGDEAGAGRSHTKPQRLSVKMFGKNSKRKCGLWGAETNSFVAFPQSSSAIR